MKVTKQHSLGMVDAERLAWSESQCAFEPGMQKGWENFVLRIPT
jgi:hypothetical protein